MSSTVHQDSQGRQVKPGDFLTDSFITLQVVSLHGSGQFVHADESGALVTNFCCCFTVCSSPAHQSPSDSLAAPAEAGQGVSAPTLEQFQRWIETEAHTAHQRYSHGCRTSLHRIANLRAAMALLLDFKDQA